MKVTKPIQASPEFIRDNQYKSGYEVICRESNKDLFEQMVEYYGECRVMQFPSGKECFFCKVM